MKAFNELCVAFELRGRPGGSCFCISRACNGRGFGYWHDKDSGFTGLSFRDVYGKYVISQENRAELDRFHSISEKIAIGKAVNETYKRTKGARL